MYVVLSCGHVGFFVLASVHGQYVITEDYMADIAASMKVRQF